MKKMIKSKVKEKEYWQTDYTNCPNCKETFHLKCLIPYNGSGYTPADQACKCPNCSFLAPLNYWIRLSRVELK